ncbi:Domain of unknown function (DUF1935), putative [Angomonas deanei]|uniref:DUF1935 domain-containing protein n=1 Tax=Angomonas deanei TaxID=59799 RepID=A0A7G2CK31_9TRYP|nr:Domain of unknown function (DUF1935), putative [Angomonas deanei]
MRWFEQVKYEHGSPAYQGDEIKKCFGDEDNGLLFQIINHDERKWAYYNDTVYYNMFIRAAFSEKSKIAPLGKTMKEVDPDTKEFIFELTVAPGATEMFLEGEPKGMKIQYNAHPK